MRLQKASEDMLEAIEASFKVMNWFASGDHLKQWSRVDHESIIAQVYGNIASQFHEFKGAVEAGPKADKLWKETLEGGDTIDNTGTNCKVQP